LCGSVNERLGQYKGMSNLRTRNSIALKASTRSKQAIAKARGLCYDGFLYLYQLVDFLEALKMQVSPGETRMPGCFLPLQA
jgi:hypothetical protein